MSSDPRDGQPELADGVPPLDQKERKKRKREGIAIAILGPLFILLTVAEFQLSKVSSTLPFVNSIFFFGLLNVNIVILIGLVWLVFRNIGKLFIERRRRILGARLKTKLVIAFLSFSIIPTLVLFVISALYINSSFDKWFSLKIQNTLQASLEITQTYYRNTDQTAMHFADVLAKGIAKKFQEQKNPAPLSAGISRWISEYLVAQRELLTLDAAEFYGDPMDERLLAKRDVTREASEVYPRLPLDLLNKSFLGEHVSAIQHIGTGDLIRCLVPVHAEAPDAKSILGVVVVSAYIPVSLVNKVGEIASVVDDYKFTNPLKYPMKTAYLVILIMITLVIIFVAIWIGFYMARELTDPVERLVHAAQAVGSGNLDVAISAIGHDEISVLVNSFNKMTSDLKENRHRLTQAGADLEQRRLQLEAILANIGTGVIAIDSDRRITTFNRAVSKLLDTEPLAAMGKNFTEVLKGESSPLIKQIEQAFTSKVLGRDPPELQQWNFRVGESIRVLAAVATPLIENTTNWGVVLVIDDMTHLIKGQREMAWREVARRIAHEIKNPLTPIKLSAQRLQRRFSDYKGRESQLLKECTDTIIKHTDELKEMVNEFSNFARFPEASPAPHDLNGALTEVIQLFQPAHPGIHFKMDIESRLPIFDFDRDQIKRVIINLLDNGVSALRSPQNGKAKQITLATHYNEQLQMAVLEISDNGPGMTDEVKARVFEPYFSTKTEGTGLGLAIAKRIVNDHDGFIRVHSVIGEGTQFLIELPIAKRASFESTLV